jgi:hypothetical protein
MFFRRDRPKKLTFEDHVNAARTAGFRAESVGAGKTRIERNGIAAVFEPGPDGVPRVTERAGVVMGKEIGTLTDEGFQKFFTTPGGKRKPALAEELKEIHNFQEDLREALGLTTLYNESLGTVSNLYLYDRVEGRDQGDHDKPWDIPAAVLHGK